MFIARARDMGVRHAWQCAHCSAAHAYARHHLLLFRSEGVGATEGSRGFASAQLWLLLYSVAHDS